MHFLIALAVGMIVGAVLATVYHTRIAPVAAKLHLDLNTAKKDAAYFNVEAIKARDELEALRRRILGNAQGLEKKL